MAGKSSNENLLEQLRNGTATFELVSSPVTSISDSNCEARPTSFRADNSRLFFARIARPVGSPAMKKVERYSVQKVTGDGRCLFRALVKGMALNKGISLNSWQEREDAAVTVINLLYCIKEIGWIVHRFTPGCESADELRTAVKEVICDSGNERRQFEEALISITVEESLKRYCQRIGRSDFWGGESELLVLSKLCSQPIAVYIPEHEHTRAGWGVGFIPIAEYGAEFRRSSSKGKPRKVVKLLYSGKNHYDLLV